jgi:hypothetical protein
MKPFIFFSLKYELSHFIYFEIDFSQIYKNYESAKKRLPPGLECEKLSINTDSESAFFKKTQFDFKRTTTENTANTNKKQYQVLKPLKHNNFLAMMLNARNVQWKTELFQTIEKENAHATSDQSNLIVKSSNFLSKTERDWSKHMNSIISDYFNLFHMEIIEYSQTETNAINSLKKSIDEIRKLYLIDYMDKKQNCKLFIMGRQEHVKDFFGRNKSLQPMSKLYANNNDDFGTIKSSLVQIPVLKNEGKIFGKNSLISLALKKLEELCDVQYVFNPEENQIELNGLKTSVENATKLLDTHLVNIKCKKVNINELSMLNLKASHHDSIALKNSLNIIVNELLNNKKAIYKVNILINNEFDNDDNDVIEIYIIFFYNFVELKSIDDNVYEEISKVLIDNLSACEIDATRFSNFMLTKNWKNFEKENLTKKTISKYLFYSLSNSHGEIKLLLVGVKSHLSSLKLEVEEFLKKYEFKTVTISLQEDDVRF